MRISWDDANRPFTQGVSQGVLYPQNSPGVPWNGLTSVNEKGDDDPDSLYLDGLKFKNWSTQDSYSGTITAFTYPDEFEPYTGMVSVTTGQPKISFGFSFRTNREIHLVYNALSSPSKNSYSSISDEISPVSFSWDFDTLPIDIPGGRPSGHLVITVDDAPPTVINSLEQMIYGADEADPYLPLPSEVLALFEDNVTLQITDNGDGTWTAVGPDEMVVDNGDGTFQITADSAIFIDDTTYRIRSM